MNWDTAVWQPVNMKKDYVSKETLCKGNKLGRVPISETLGAFEVLDLCRKMGGKMSVIRNVNDFNQSIDWLRSNKRCSGNSFNTGDLWAGWTDEFSEFEYVDMNDHSIQMSDQVQKLWRNPEPNGDRIENCANLHLNLVDESRNGLLDVNCKIRNKHCGMCEIGAAPIFTIRGLCDDTLFDRHYGWASEKSEISEKYKFQGFSSSAIFWDETKSYWKLQYNSNSSIYAICNQTDCLPYPFGRKEWFIFNDEACLLPFQSSSKSQLSFNSCPQDKFNCWDGNCIDMSQKCDGTNDCQDKSDEFQCNKIISDVSYLKSSPPPAVSKRHSKLKVKIETEIAAILDIVEMDSSMELQLKLTLSWSDARLKFQKLKKNENLNSLTPEEKDIIWMPVLVFLNTKNRFVATLKNESSFATISINPGAKETLSPMDQVDNIYLYDGIDCTITATTYLSVDFICDYYMARYPFDTQSCIASFGPKANSDFFIELDPIGEPTYNGTRDVLRYVLDSIQYKNDDIGKEIRIELIFGRQLLAEFLTTILPTILIVLVKIVILTFSKLHNFCPFCRLHSAQITMEWSILKRS